MLPDKLFSKKVSNLILDLLALKKWKMPHIWSSFIWDLVSRVRKLDYTRILDKRMKIWGWAVPSSGQALVSWIKSWKRLLTETVPVNISLLTGTVPFNNFSLIGTVPVNNSSLTGTRSLSIITYRFFENYLSLNLDCMAKINDCVFHQFLNWRLLSVIFGTLTPSQFGFNCMKYW